MTHLADLSGHARVARYLSITLVLATLPAASASYDGFLVAAPAAIVATPVAAATDPLAPEYGANRPADLDASPAPIPPAELWPAQ